MMEFNLVNPKQGIGLLGSSEKLQERKTGLPVRRQTGKEPEQMMPFFCMMGQICRITTQETEKTNQSLPVKGRGPEVRGQRSEVGGQRSEVRGQPLAHRGLRPGGRSEMVDAPGLLKFNLKNAVAVKGKGIAKSPHSAIPESEAACLRLPVQEWQTGAPHRQAKNINAAGLFATAASKDKGVKTNGSIPGKIDLLSKSAGQKQTEGKVENLLESTGLKKGKSGINHVLTGDAKEPLKPGLNKQSIESGPAKSGLIKAVVEENEAVKKTRTLKAADTVGQNLRTGKIGVAVSKEGGFRESWAGINNALGKGQKAKGRGQRAKMDDAPGVLRPGLKNAAAAKGKIAEEPGRTKKKSFIPIKDNGGKNGIENILKHSILKGEETVARHEKTGVKGFTDHNNEILHRKTSLLSHSSSHLDKISSAGGYHHTSFHLGGGSAVINESVNSHVIEPRALIDQIASGVKRPGRVRITLNPPRLGTLDVDVLVRDNKVHVILRAENNDVRQVLQSNVESLKSSLRNHGLVSDTINVLVQEKTDSANYGADYKSGQNETLFKEGGNREGHEEDHGREQDSLNYDPSSLEEENQRVRSDGRISLFA